MGYRIKRLQDVARGIRLSKELAERERWPRERLRRFQQEHLNELVRFACERSTFWRERIPGAGPVRLEDVPVSPSRS